MTTPAATSWPESEGSGLYGAAGDPAVLLVSLDEVARRLGLVASALDTVQSQALTDAIADAQADLQGKLNRPLVPRTEQLEGERPYTGFDDLDDPKAYGLPARFDDLVAISARVPNEDDAELWDLTVKVGLDGSAHPAITRWIRAHAVESLRLDPVAQRTLGLETAMTSVSAEGQSITPEKRPTTPGLPGALPSWDSIKGFRRVAAYRRQHPVRTPWPYFGS